MFNALWFCWKRMISHFSLTSFVFAETASFQFLKELDSFLAIRLPQLYVSSKECKWLLSCSSGPLCLDQSGGAYRTHMLLSHRCVMLIYRLGLYWIAIASLGSPFVVQFIRQKYIMFLLSEIIFWSKFWQSKREGSGYCQIAIVKDVSLCTYTPKCSSVQAWRQRSQCNIIYLQYMQVYLLQVTNIPENLTLSNAFAHFIQYNMYLFQSCLYSNSLLKVSISQFLNLSPVFRPLVRVRKSNSVFLALQKPDLTN